MTRKAPSIIAVAASLALGGVAFSQQSDHSGPAGSSARSGQLGQQDAQQVDQQVNQQLQQFSQDPRTAPDKLFVLEQGLGNQMEIQLAQQAQSKAQNDQVKQLAQQIIQDHTQAFEQLKQVAQKLDVQLPQGLTQMKQQELRIMSALPADQFEKHFIVHMQCAHAKDVTKYRAVAQLSQNEQVKQFAQQTLPKLQQHAQQTQQAAVALGLPSGDITGEARPAGARIGGSDSSSDRDRNDRDR